MEGQEEEQRWDSSAVGCFQPETYCVLHMVVFLCLNVISADRNLCPPWTTDPRKWRTIPEPVKRSLGLFLVCVGRKGRGENGCCLLQQELPALECSYEGKDLQGSVLVVSTVQCSQRWDAGARCAVREGRLSHGWEWQQGLGAPGLSSLSPALPSRNSSSQSRSWREHSLPAPAQLLEEECKARGL